MLKWIAQNAVTIIAIAAVLAIVCLAVFSLVKGKKKSKCGCPGGCASCGMACPYCHGAEPTGGEDTRN